MQFLQNGWRAIGNWLRSRSNPCSRFSGPGHPRSMQFLWDRCSTKSDWKLDNAPYTSMFVNWMYIVGYHREYQSEQQHAQIHHSSVSIVVQISQQRLHKCFFYFEFQQQARYPEIQKDYLLRLLVLNCYTVYNVSTTI